MYHPFLPEASWRQTCVCGEDSACRPAQYTAVICSQAFKQPFGQPSQLIDMICKGEGNLKDK